MKSSIPDLVAAAMQAAPENIEQAVKILQGKAPVQAPPVEPLLTATQVANQLSISRMSIHRWKIPSYPLAGKPRFQMSVVLRYLKSDEFKAQAEHLRRTRVFTRKEA
jgi:hypothetical protein